MQFKVIAMKRKLEEEDPPTSMDTSPPEIGLKDAQNFESLGLDYRLLQAIAHEKFRHPTQVQAQVIPLALEGRDILARAHTGSGKTAAFVLPILESILRRKKSGSGSKAVCALILVPTRELADQVSKVVATFSSHCAKDVRVLNLTLKIPENVQRSLLAEAPEVVVGTPAGAVLHIRSSALSLDHLSHLVIDEADLVLSYGYEEDLSHIADVMPTGIQASLMSATLTTELDTLSSLFCKNPFTLALDERKEDNKVSQFMVKCAEDEKFLLAYVIFKLKLVKGKFIIFVADIDRCYRLKLFLEQFGIKSCVLNSELPLNSRLHVVEEFNKNVYDIIIASDEAEVLGSDQLPLSKPSDEKIMDDNVAEAETGTTNERVDGVDQSKRKRKPPRKAQKDKEYGVSRGIDFKSVACVFNFDLPSSPKSYTHRIGRTARAGKTGLALSFMVPKVLYRKHKSTSIPASEHDEAVMAAIIVQQEKRGKQMEDYHFNMAQVEAFRYRMTDALRAVTSVAVREARTRELRIELLNSDKLKRHFEENPADLQHLRHDGELRAARIQPHLKHVPDYLLPNGAKTTATEKIGFLPIKRSSETRSRRAGMFNRSKGRSQNAHRKLDPLKSFKVRNRKEQA